MKKRDRKELGRYIRAVADEMELRDWTLHLEIKSPEAHETPDGHCWEASCEPVPGRKVATILASKDADAALESCTEHGYAEGWGIIDGALVIYDVDSPPAWLAPVLAARDDDGNTPLA